MRPFFGSRGTLFSSHGTLFGSCGTLSGSHGTLFGSHGTLFGSRGHHIGFTEGHKASKMESEIEPKVDSVQKWKNFDFACIRSVS